MTRTVLALALVLLSAAAFAADQDPIVTLYQDVRDALQRDPGSPTAVLTLRPPADAANAAQRAAFDEIVTALSLATAQKPASFATAYNYYLALWDRHIFYGQPADAALEQLDKAAKLADPASDQAPRCHYDRAVDLLTLKKDEDAISEFIAARRSAANKGYYAASSSLQLGELYIAKGKADLAKTALRDAIETDTAHGYITNRACDRLGILRLAEGNTEAGLAMLEAAGKVKLDEDTKTFGHSTDLAQALVGPPDAKEIDSARLTVAVNYLEHACDALTQARAAVPPALVYTLALGYTKLGKTSSALLYWKQYLDLKDPDAARRKQAKAIAQSLAMPTSKTP